MPGRCYEVRRALGVAVALAASLSVSVPVYAQATARESSARRMSVSWSAVPIRDVLRAFAAYSGSSIVAGANVSALVTADINDQPWDVVLGTILSVHGLVATADEHGIIRVENMVDLADREVVEPLLVRSYRISYQKASELQAAIAPLLTERGSVSLVESSNTLVVTDIERVQRSVGTLLH